MRVSCPRRTLANPWVTQRALMSWNFANGVLEFLVNKITTKINSTEESNLYHMDGDILRINSDLLSLIESPLCSQSSFQKNSTLSDVKHSTLISYSLSRSLGPGMK